MQIIHVICHYLYLVFTDVGIYIALVEQGIAIEPLFGHTQDSSYGLHSECVACELAEYQQYCGSRAIPSQGNSLLEQQHLGDIVIALDVFKIGLLLRQPYGKAMIISVDAFHHVKILHHLLHNLRVVGSHCVTRVVRQLYE